MKIECEFNENEIISNFNIKKGTLFIIKVVSLRFDFFVRINTLKWIYNINTTRYTNPAILNS